MKHLFPLLVFTLATLSGHAASPIIVSGLECEHQHNPGAISTGTPRLGWQLKGKGQGLRQTHYQVLASSSADKLAAGKGDLWNSGETYSYRSQHIALKGEPLKPGQTVHWKVRIKDHEDQWSKWSEPATFTYKPDARPERPLPLYRKKAPRISSFESSDETLNKLYASAAGRLPEMTSLLDIHLSLRAACYHRDLFPRAINWLSLLNASTTDQDYYPGSLPAKTEPGSLNSDAGILAAHSLYLMSGDRRVLTDNWKTMHKYLTARKKIDPDFSGQNFGELPAGAVPEGNSTPEELIHSASHGLVYRIMTELSRTAAETPFETPILETGYTNLQSQFQERYLGKDGKLTVDTALAQLITLRFGLLSTTEQKETVSNQFWEKFKKRPAAQAFVDGPLAVSSLLPVLTWTGHHDHALNIVKKQSPDKLSPVAHVAISEWLIWMVGGIDSAGSGFQHVRYAPYIPARDVLSFAKASYETLYGTVTGHWRHEDDGLHYEVSFPPNSFATVVLPAKAGANVTLNGKPLEGGPGIISKAQEGDNLVVSVQPGQYHFHVAAP